MSGSIFRILESGDLSKAGDLFSVEDSLIVSEFDTIVEKIKEISSAAEFLSSHNDQSLVEIVITRLISAVRETNSIQLYARSMVDLLQSCLSHSLRPGSRGDPPHAKMASDLMSCLFLNYNKKSIMILAIPVAVKFLHKGNKELSRNMASYLSLAAIENADMLAIHCQPILDSVISGNYSLARVLPAIYSVDCQLIKNHVMTLVSILPNCSDTDSLALLNLFHLLSKDFPQLLEPSIPQLCECLTQSALTTATIQVLREVGKARSHSLYDHIPVFKAIAERFPAQTLAVIQLLTTVSISSVDKSRNHIIYLLEKVPSVDTDKQILVLKELSSITSKYPSLLNSNLISKLTGLEDQVNDSTKELIEEIKNEYYVRRLDRSLEKLSMKDKMNPKPGATLISIKALPDPKGKESKPIGRFSTHRSMTRLNIHNAGRLDNRLTHKSMTRLDHRYFSNQLVAATGPGANISHKNKHLSLVQTGSPPPGITPVKSMSSGSVTGLDYNRSTGIIEPAGWTAAANRAVTAGGEGGGWSSRGGGITAGGEGGGWSSRGEGGWGARIGVGDGGVTATSAWDRDHRDVGENQHESRIGSRDQLEHRINSRDHLDPRLNSRDKLTLSINKITTDLARQSSRLSTVLNQEYAKSPTVLGQEYAKSSSVIGQEYTKSQEYEKPPPEYSRISAEYKMPPDYKSITGEYGRQASGSGRDIHNQPHSINSYQSISLAVAGQKRITAHSSGPIYSPTRMYSSGQLLPGSSSGQQPPSLTSQQPAVAQQQPPAYSDSWSQPHHRPLSGSIPLGPGQTYPFPGTIPNSTHQHAGGSSSSHHYPTNNVYHQQNNPTYSHHHQGAATHSSQHFVPQLPPHSSNSTHPFTSLNSHHIQMPTIVNTGVPGAISFSAKSGFSSSSHALQISGSQGGQGAQLFSLPPAESRSGIQEHHEKAAGPPSSLEQPFKESVSIAHPSSQDQLAKYADQHYISKSSFSNTLPSLRKRSALAASTTSSGSAATPGDKMAGPSNRMSVFEPFPMRDTVQHFCEKHLDKIKIYMESVSVKIPLPVKCTIEERKGKKHAKLHFACQGRGEHCLYKVKFYTMKTRHPRTWIHLMFLALQSRSSSALSTRDAGVSSLKNCWEIIKCEEKSFSTLVTGAFPPAKDQDSIIHELHAHRFFDVFEYNAPYLQWGCFLCNHPERASTFIQEEEPVIEGQLKEKSGGKWKIFKKWKSRYFTLSGAKLVYKESKPDGVGVIQSLDVGSIRSVKVSKGGRNIPKAFEIFTADKTYILKAKDSSNAQEWVQCLSVAVAHSQARDTNLQRLGYGGSLGRLTSGAGRINHPITGMYSNVTLRTAV